MSPRNERLGQDFKKCFLLMAHRQNLTKGEGEGRERKVFKASGYSKNARDFQMTYSVSFQNKESKRHYVI